MLGSDDEIEFDGFPSLNSRPLEGNSRAHYPSDPHAVAPALATRLGFHQTIWMHFHAVRLPRVPLKSVDVVQEAFSSFSEEFDWESCA